MTWSIIARDSATGQFGIAVVTKFFAVGALVPHIAAGRGAVATQALVNPYYGIDGVRLLRDGWKPHDIIETLTFADDGRESRQLHIMDAEGRIAAHTGRECVDWCGHVKGDGFSIAGNMLAGAAVLGETAKAYVANESLPFPQRLIAAMQAGEAAGGDKRGKQSAALLIHGEEEWPVLDLRVDDHPDPLPELARLEAVSRELWVHFRNFLPTRTNPAAARILEHGRYEPVIAGRKVAHHACSPRPLFQVHPHTFGAIQEPLEVKARERIVGVQSNQRGKGRHRRGITGL
jgi:uncharacterized Ntn-hydrolase superfamily protein